jgi:glycosyltransferase involved in cell wall biosynthesis
MFISVVIPTHNKCTVLLQTLQRFLIQTLPPEQYKVIVVGNNCTDDTEQAVKSMIGGAIDIRYVSETRVGRGAARNAGINVTRDEVVLFIDDDILIEPDHLERHLAYHDGTPLAVMGRVRDVSQYRPAILGEYMLEKQFAGAWAILDPTIDLENVPGLYVVTQSLSVSRSALELIAMPDLHESRMLYFDESLLSRQDTDLGIRLQRKGVRIKVARDMWSEHNHPRDWRGVRERSQRSGYWARVMMQKYPDLAKPPKHLYPLPVAYASLAFAACALPFALALFPFWRWPIFKCIGIWAAFETNLAYWRAERDINDSR